MERGRAIEQRRRFIGRRGAAGEALGCALLSVVAVGCSPTSGETSQGSASPPVVTPSSAYAPFPYASEAQRAAFSAFLSCAARHGVHYQGPFADSTGTGIFVRLAPGETATHAQRNEIAARCPEFTVATFGTKLGTIRTAAFEDAASSFARCVRRHGIDAFRSPRFGAGDPLDVFWRLPFDWSNAPFVGAVRSCIDPLRTYVFGG